MSEALNPLLAVSPIDGRYRGQAQDLSHYFSEYALIKYRLTVEIEYFIALSEAPLPQLKKVGKSKLSSLRKIFENFNLEEANHVKQIEKVTNHDVKALEYYLKEKFDQIGLSGYKEFIHFGLTSQDINNTANPMAIRDALVEVYYPHLTELVKVLKRLAKDWQRIPMLARTHGQPASPTRLGKEILVFVERIEMQLKLLKAVPHSGKFGGATGNFNAHHVAFPKVHWPAFADRFLKSKLGISRSKTTTQIEHYDNLAAQLDGMKRINTILLDLSRDIWSYVSFNYFKQKIKKGEVGSSAMPHKVNPIDFENAEGNIGLANSLFEHLSSKLPVSRLQRDLTDSTVLRNIGVPFGHTLIAFKSILKGLNKLVVNKVAIEEDLEANWAVVAEAIQTILRREGYPKPYEALKSLTRTNTSIGKSEIQRFIQSLKVSDKVKKELLKISPLNYTGI